MTRVVIEGLSRNVAGAMHLADIDLCLEPGTFTVLLGASNAGKTSLLRSIAGLDRPSAGTVRLEDGEGRPLRDARDRVAMVYQEFVNYPSMTVFENIASPLRASRRLDARELDRRVREAAQRFGLEDLLARLPAELSGGQQQRTALARALIKEADVVLLDEPLANLDYKLREGLRDEILRTFSERRATVVYASSDPVEALWFGERAAVLHEGRLLQEGPAREVYDAPQGERVACAISDPPMNVWPARRAAGGHLTLVGGLDVPCPEHLESLAEGAWRTGLRSHRLRLERRGPVDVRVPARLELAEVTGSETTLHGSFGDARVLALIEGVHTLERGRPLDLYFDPGDLFAFSEGGSVVGAPRIHGDD